MKFGSRIECALTIPAMYSGFEAPLRLSQMDTDGAFENLEQKKLIRSAAWDARSERISFAHENI